MNIYTYYKPIQAMGGKAQELIIDIWKKSWIGAGFVPVVIGENEARSNPMFPRYSDIMAVKPLMNMADYELACFFRWAAMSQIGGGLMADYDCLNNGFSPDDIQETEMTIYEPPHIPCLVSGSALEYHRMMEMFMRFNISDYKDWLKPHSHGGKGTSDMLILANYPEEFKTMPYVRQYTDNGWETSKAIHFSNRSCGGQKLSEMNKWLKTLST